jgi:hypothetical protein
MFIVLKFGKLTYNRLKKIFPLLKKSKIDIEENLPNYWAALDENDRRWTIKEEENSRNLLNGVKILTN